ncbi:hypothetical protein RJT34_30024 [Clitoria ternatea]|uniref:Uncharacterized protein n=1 Tax=Clitoria ternatea TaxID=43366 RepID=A0AAN9I6Y4_CLITE
MLSKFLSSFCFMGHSSNLEVFFPKENNKHNLNEIHHLARQGSTREDHEFRPKQLLVGQEDNNVAASLDLKVKIPSLDEAEREKEYYDSNEGFKTPTSPEHRIPAMLPYPPAPRKPKSAKRKSFQPRTVLDVSQEIESLFPVDIGVAGKSKKIKLLPNS